MNIFEFLLITNITGVIVIAGWCIFTLMQEWGKGSLSMFLPLFCWYLPLDRMLPGHHHLLCRCRLGDHKLPTAATFLGLWLYIAVLASTYYSESLNDHEYISEIRACYHYGFFFHRLGHKVLYFSPGSFIRLTWDMTQDFELVSSISVNKWYCLCQIVDHSTLKELQLFQQVVLSLSDCRSWHFDSVYFSDAQHSVNRKYWIDWCYLL